MGNSAQVKLLRVRYDSSSNRKKLLMFSDQLVGFIKYKMDGLCVLVLVLKKEDCSFLFGGIIVLLSFMKMIRTQASFDYLTCVNGNKVYGFILCSILCIWSSCVKFLHGCLHVRMINFS